MHFIETIACYLLLTLQAVFAIYMLIPLLSLLTFGVMKIFSRPPIERYKKITEKNTEFGIVITAHQETMFIFPLVDSLLKQDYGNFFVYIVADDCNVDTLKFSDNRITVLRPPVPLNSKIRSIHYAIDKFINKHDAIIIFDADNVIHPSFLGIVNQYFQKGFKVVQADFKPKNTDTDFARMDAIGDMFNFFIERQSRMWAGLSAAIWGSGVAIDYNLYKEVEYSSFLGGFDKKLQSHLVKRVRRIAFAEEAILYDEKINSGKSLQTQRTRWISSYFKYFKESFSIFWKGITRPSFNLFYFGFITLRPPLFIVLGMSFIFAILNYFLIPAYAILWPLLFLSFLISFAAIVAIKGRDARFIKTFFLLPVFAFRQVLALLKIKKANKSFLKTAHSKMIFIDDILKK